MDCHRVTPVRHCDKARMRKLDIYVFITIIVLIPLLVDPEGIILPFFIASSLTWLSICIYILDLQFPNCKSKLTSHSLSLTNR